jgi:phosphoribosylformylglycinamidine synthase subunit PurL
LLEDIHNKMTLDFKQEGDLIFLLGIVNDDINCSEYLHKVCGVAFSPAPYFDLDEEYRMQQKVQELISVKVIESAQDISEGGLFISLCEAGFNRELGFSIKTNEKWRPDAFLFGEGQGRVVVSVAASSVAEFKKWVGDLPCELIGMVTSGEMLVDDDFWGTIDWWKDEYDRAIENYLSKESAGSALISI